MTMTLLEQEERRIALRRERKKQLEEERKAENKCRKTLRSANSGRLENEKQVMLETYKKKLALFVVEELNEATQIALSRRQSSESQMDIGLSIDSDAAKSVSSLPSKSLQQLRSHRSRMKQGRQAEKVISSLWTQLTSPIPAEIRTQLNFDKKNKFFYEVISSHFGSPSVQAYLDASLISRCSILYSTKNFPAFFTLTFYRYLLKHEDFGTAGMNDRIKIKIFQRGLAQLFSQDIANQTTKMFPLFNYFNVKLRQKIRQQPRRKKTYELFTSVLTRFYFYYCSSSETTQLRHFLRDLDITLVDFVAANIDNVARMKPGHLKNITLRQHYITSIGKATQLTEYTTMAQDSNHSVKMAGWKKVLTTFTVHGAPYYANCNEQKAASATLALMFPNGSKAVALVTSLFRLTRPSFYTNLVSTYLDKGHP